ncbi:hypothetical protein TeGR_g4416 [Tetraparma gracilis]|uniref:Ribosomal RNA large subunit methyltransferase K/L-like methyltransferase domain-containing protein n=1 Tax=Tetraparma gracilis TaxID=2962635 RepID=A0ABQ6N2P1_9STRA|nr:hypothetical protein TeGR_g4416 [Tetraparma gracilis]
MAQPPPPPPPPPLLLALCSRGASFALRAELLSAASVEAASLSFLGPVQVGLEAFSFRLRDPDVDALDAFARGLRFAMDVHVLLARFPVPLSFAASSSIASAAAAAAWVPLSALLPPAPPSLPLAFRATVLRQSSSNLPRHAWSSQDAQAWLGDGVAAATGWPVDLDRFSREAVLFVLDEAGTLTLPLYYFLRGNGPSTFSPPVPPSAAPVLSPPNPGEGKTCRFGSRWLDSLRPYKRSIIHDSPSLRPSLARAVLSLLSLPPGGVFLDPVGGSGTLALEAADLFPHSLCLSSDLDPLSGLCAARNARDLPADSLRMDARKLALRAGVADGAAADLPYGRMCKMSHNVRTSFGRAVIAEAGRLLAPGGRLALLAVGSDAPDAFRKTAGKAGLRPLRLGLEGERGDGELVVYSSVTSSLRARLKKNITFLQKQLGDPADFARHEAVFKASVSLDLEDMSAALLAFRKRASYTPADLDVLKAGKAFYDETKNKEMKRVKVRSRLVDVYCTEAKRDSARTEIEILCEVDMGGRVPRSVNQSVTVPIAAYGPLRMATFFAAARPLAATTSKAARELGFVLCYHLLPLQGRENELQLQVELKKLMVEIEVLRIASEDYEWLDELLFRVLRNKINYTNTPHASLENFSRDDAEASGKALGAILLCALSPENGVAEWIGGTPALVEFGADHAWFAPMMEAMAGELLSRSTLGVMLRAYLGAAFSVLDLLSDSWVTLKYFADGPSGRVFAYAMLGMILASLLAQLVIVYVQNVGLKKDRAKTMLREALYVLCFVKPGEPPLSEYSPLTSPRLRKENPEHFGLIRSTARGVTFAAIFVLTALQLLVKGSAFALLAVTDMRYLAGYIGIDYSLHYLYLILRRDFVLHFRGMGWLAAYILSFFVRTLGKVVADFTVSLHTRVPHAFTGIYWR